MTFKEWFNSAPHRAKYTDDHPAYLAAQESWEAAHEVCAKLEIEMALSPAHFVTMAEWRAYREGVEEYAAAIRARGNHANG